MILVIRISGAVDLSSRVEETLFRMRLRRKYSAVLVKPSVENLKLLRKMRDFVAFGEITPENLIKLIEKRAKPISSKDKIDALKIVKELEKKKLSDLGVKPFFRLHPPRGGIESKKHFGVGKGVLGDNKSEINKLLERMF